MVLTSKFLSILIIITCTVPARLNIVTSITDIADIARNVGGDSVSVFSLAKGSEDMHRVRVRSSFLPKIKRADFVMSLGLFAESFWLKPLVSSSRNDFVKQGKPGWVEVYKGLEILEKPTEKEAATMLHHKKGNPHYNNGPYCGKYMAKNIYKALIGKDPKNKEYYTINYNNYIQKLAEMEKKLLEKAAPLKGVHVISYHADLAYFCKFYGMEMTGCLEPKPGLAPTTRHLAKLVVQAKKNKTKLILYHQAQNPRLPKRVADKTGAELVCFANMVKAREDIQTYIQLHYYNLNLMLDAVKEYNSK